MVVLLLGTTTAGTFLLISKSKYTTELENQLSTLQQQVKLSAVDRSVSRQMEEIAFQQQAISERRREEAVVQTQIAQEMTQRSEIERKHALKAQSIAEASEKDAREAYLLADNHRKIAERQRLQAEYSKRVADTLNYISMSRSLGSQAFLQYQAGDTVIGTMLAYTSYLFSREYHGNLYTPNVFQALTLTSKGQKERNVHNGSISRVEWNRETNQLVSISTYGEIFTHELRNGVFVTQRLFQNSQYDFRDVFSYYATGAIYAISRTGHLVVARSGKTDIMPVEKVSKPFRLSYFDSKKELLIVGENALAIYDIPSNKIIETRQLDFNIECVGRLNHKPLLFDNKGRMHLVNSLNDFTTSKVPVPGNITSFTSLRNSKACAYGTMDGMVYIVDSIGSVQQLIGHRSRVTQIKFTDDKLYTTSLDGKLLLWVIDANQIKPVTLFQADSWLLDFTYDNKKNYLWTGDMNGKLTQHLISLELIQDRIRKRIKRDFTKQEWDYYIGSDIPFRSFLK